MTHTTHTVGAVDLMMAFRKADLVRMAKALLVSNEINPRARKATIVADLSEVLAVEDVLGWAENAGFKVTVS